MISSSLLRNSTSLTRAVATRNNTVRSLSALPKGPSSTSCSSSSSPSSPNPKKTLSSSLAEHRRELHQSARREQADATAASPTTATTPTPTTTPLADDAQATVASSLAARFTYTAEVTVSKIFPAGFGWQSSSIVAESYFGYQPESLNFALTTGLGDAIGVLTGHCLYYATKKAVTGADDSSIHMVKELHTGILLGSAAFCSGTAWQPIVNALQGAELPFSQVFMGTWMGCGMAFYGGLRLGRTLLSGPLSYIEQGTFENSQTDFALSTAIGGATGFFVGTDAAYLPHQNFLVDVVGIVDGTPDLQGCAIAGASTSLGFFTTQAGMNLVYPAKKCWVD